MVRVRDGQGGSCFAIRRHLRDLDRSTGRIVGPVAGFADKRERETGPRGGPGPLPAVIGKATEPVAHNCRFARHDGMLRVAAVLRSIAALLHFVAIGKNGGGKAFDGQ